MILKNLNLQAVFKINGSTRNEIEAKSKKLYVYVEKL